MFSLFIFPYTMAMSDNTPNVAPFSDERNFLDHYFTNIYYKLEADALLFNRKLPHAGLVGSENEQALGGLLRDFLPPRFGIEVNALIIDKHGNSSKQADIVIYDATRPKFLRKVFPIEIVYCVIEVKTSMGQSEAVSALENIKSVNRLDFRPALTPYWQTRTKENNLAHYPPAGYIFAYRTNCESFETFARWFAWGFFNDGIRLQDAAPIYPEARVLRVVGLDQGTIEMESTNGHVMRLLAQAADDHLERSFRTTLMGAPVRVDPAKSLFLFMNRLWFDLEFHALHPGFDIRSYVSGVLGSVVKINDEHLER
jgi:Domain of unknown function (DUF6602)